MPFVQIPTTLLAMVDASVGGKTGMNHAVGKNLIGAFHQPIAVLIDPQTLRTLAAARIAWRAWLSASSTTSSATPMDLPNSNSTSAGHSLDIDSFPDALVAHNVAIKARVVEADPFERGERAHLNFGHTFGHAIETVSHYALFARRMRRLGYGRGEPDWLARSGAAR